MTAPFSQGPAAPLLPPNATPFERAIEATGAARHPLPVDLVRAVWNADTCPAHLLGYLAWGLSVDLWDEAWPELKKREVCRKALWLHRIKTTPQGIRAHVALVDAELVGVVRPPAREHMRRSITEADREAWLDRLPQIRIYPYARRGAARPAHAFASRPARMAFLGEGRRMIGASLLAGFGIETGEGVPVAGMIPDPDAPVLAAFGIENGAGLPVAGFIPGPAGRPAPRRFAIRSRGFAIYRRRARWIDPASGLSEVDAGLSLSQDGLVEHVAVRQSAGPRQFFGRAFAGNGHLLRSRADFSLLTLRIDHAEAASVMVPPGARPADVAPRRVAVRRPARPGRAHFGRAWCSGTGLAPLPAPRRSDGPLLLYDRIAIAVPGRFHPRLKATAFAGRGRFGIAPFTAELRIKVPMQRKSPFAPRWHGQGYLHQASMRPFWRAIEAVRVSKALRDTIHVTTTTTRRVRFGYGLRFGDFEFGQMRKVS